MTLPYGPPGRKTALPDAATPESGILERSESLPAPHFTVATAAANTESVAGRVRTFEASPTAASERPGHSPANFGQTRRRTFREIAVVFIWEIKSFLLRPTSYVLLLAAAAVAGWSFSWLVTLLARGTDPALRSADDPVSQFLGPNVFLIGAATLFIPLLTMSAIADERRRGSWELLLTAPVSPFSVVLGKFAAMWCQFLACLAPWFYYATVLHGWNGRTRLLWNIVPWFDGSGLAFDWGLACGGFVGLTMVAATFVAAGLFCSGLCRAPASAGLLSLVVMGLILLLGFVPRVMESWSFSATQISFFSCISCWSHVERFSRGVIEPRIIAGHLSACAALLWGTVGVMRRVDEG